MGFMLAHKHLFYRATSPTPRFQLRKGASGLLNLATMKTKLPTHDALCGK